jgi:plasmid stabilization system protein ParE
MKLRFTRRALENISDIAAYVREQNPAAALRVQSDIYDTLQNLLIFPRAGRRQSARTVRKLVTPRYSYLIYYRVDETAEEIVVLNVKHPARERDYLDI